MKFDPDRHAAMTAGGLDERIGLQRRSDAQRVIGAPRPEWSTAQGQAVRPAREREAGRAGDVTDLVLIEPASCGQRRREMPDGCRLQACRAGQVVEARRSPVADERGERRFAQQAGGVDRGQQRLVHAGILSTEDRYGKPYWSPENPSSPLRAE
jgi:hypothetical protein